MSRLRHTSLRNVTLPVPPCDLSTIHDHCPSSPREHDATIADTNTHFTPPLYSTPRKQKILVDTQTSPAFKSDNIELSNSLTASPTRPLTLIEEKLTTSLIKRKQTKEGKILTCRTGGPPLSLQIISKSKKETHETSISTQRRKCKELEEYISASVGKNTESKTLLLANELKRSDINSKNEILKQSGMERRIVLDNEKVLAMKVESDLSYSQLRKQRKYLKEAGVVLPHEKKQRDLVNEITKDTLAFQLNEFEGDGAADIISPIGCIENLRLFVSKHLDSLNENNQLSWHEKIPEDEIWIKFGGDHGKSSFKLTMQVVNVKNPNSKTNTIVLAMANVKDTYENLQLLMSSVQLQLEDLKTLQWNGKKIKMFVFGDYDFYCKVFGISGAQATYPCLWCLIPKDELQQPHITTFEARTLTNLFKDCDDWEMETGADKNQAKYFHNCVNRPMLKIELDHVAPPYLHILLGVMKKHHELLEKAADSLDLDISTQNEDDTTGVQLSSVAASLRDYGGNWRNAESVKNGIMFHEGLIQFGASHMTEETVNEEMDKLENIDRTDISSRSGPISSQLDSINLENGIIAQKFHNRSYIGNHCHRYFKDKVYKKCTQAMLQKQNS